MSVLNGGFNSYAVTANTFQQFFVTPYGTDTSNNTYLPNWTLNITDAVSYLCLGNGTGGGYGTGLPAATGGSSQCFIAQHGGSNPNVIKLSQPVYLSVGTYTVSFYSRLRVFSPSSPPILTVKMSDVSNTVLSSTTVTLTTSWTQYSYNFAVTAASTYTLLFTFTSTNTSSSTDNSTFFTDVTIYPNPKGIYSAKWINPLYTGPIFTFRRSADNVTRDFYVSEDGALIGDAPAGEGTTLTTWLGASTAYVTKWWDQSLFGNHATQTTNANQPTFNSTGKYLQFTAASSQFFNLPDGTVPSGNSTYTVTVKHGTITNTGTTGANSGGVLGSGTASTNSINAFSIGTASTSNYSNYWWSNDFGNKGTYAANNTITWKYDKTNRYLYTNSALTTSAASSGRASGTTNNFIGRGDTTNNNYLDGQLYFIYVYSSALDDSNRILVELNAGVSTRTYNLTGAFNTSYPVYKQTLTSPAYTVSCASSDGKNMISIQGTYPNYIVLYSNNYGQSWGLSNAPVSIYSTAGFSCCSPVNYTNVFYLGTINGSFKLFRSADGGATWTLISTAFTNIAGMCVNNDDTILYLSNFQNAVHYSTRAGNTSFNYTTNTGTFTFTQITNSNNSFQYGKMICSPDGAYLYGTASGSNRAFSYTFSNTSSFNSTLTSAYNTNVCDVAMSSNGSYLYASLYFNANYTIIRSTNGGTSFTDIGTTVITKNIAAYVNCDPTGQYIQVYNTGGAGWWISSDYGASFTSYSATSIPTVPKIWTNNMFYSLATNTTTSYVTTGEWFEPYGNRYYEPYVLPDNNPGTLIDAYRSTSTAITFPTLSSSISNVKFVVSNGNAAVVRLTTGNAVIIGATVNGGNPSQTIKDALNSSSNVIKIVCNDTAFCAIYTVSNIDTRRRVIHWGYYGASDIETIGTGNTNFRNISTVQSSLDLVDISDIAVNSAGAFVALSTTGVVYAWGDKATGGDPANATSPSIATNLSTLLSGTDSTFGLCTRLIFGKKHFGVISSNKRGVVWGNKTNNTSGGYIYDSTILGVDDILLASTSLSNCIFLRIPETANPFSVSVSNINSSGTVNTQSLFTGLTAKPRYLIQRMGIGRTTALITITLSDYIWVYLDNGLRLITFGVTTGEAFQTLTNNSTGLSYSNVQSFAANLSVITLKTSTGYNTFATQINENVTNTFASMTNVEEVPLALSISPLLSYKFESNAGTTVPNLGTSSTTNDITLYNGAGIGTSVVKYGSGSLDLSGTNYTDQTTAFPVVAGFNYARINGTVTLTSGSNFSVSLWFYMTSRVAGAYPMFFSINDNSNRIYVAMFTDTATMVLGCPGGGNGGQAQSTYGGTITTAALALNTWHYIGWSVSGGTWTIRLNGQTGSITGKTAPTVTSFTQNTLGIDTTTTSSLRKWSGYLDNVRFFNGSLTATDLTNLYNEPPSSITPGILKYNLNRQLKYKPSSSVITAYGSGTAGTTALTETYTNAVEMYTGANAYAVSQTSPSQYTLVEAITNANQKTTIARPANKNTYFGPSGKGLYALEIPFNPYVTPSSLYANSSSSLSYYVSNPDLAAERWSTYALSTSGSSLVQIGGQYSTYDNISHTYVFSDVSFSTVGTKTLYIWSVVPDLCYNVLSFTVPVVPAPVYPCFLEGSKILRLNPISDQEEYVPIETLREGDLIKTSRNGYKAIFYIGRKTLPSPATDSDIRNRLYRFPRSAHKDMIDDLCITGEHCTLHDNLSSDKLKQVREHMGDVYITEYMIRVPACLDERAEPYTDDTPVTIWHIALENHNIYHNYGIYANGLLVESCSIQYLTELSNMELV